MIPRSTYDRTYVLLLDVFFFRGSINSIIILTLTFVTKCDSYIQGAVLLTAAGRYIIFCILHADAVLSCQDIFTGIFELDFMT